MHMIIYNEIHIKLIPIEVTYIKYNICCWFLQQFHWHPFVVLCFLAAAKQPFEWFSPSIRLSGTLLSRYSHHRIIMTFSGVITNDRNDDNARAYGHRSKVKVTEVKIQFSSFRTLNLAWIYTWRLLVHKVWCGIREVSYCFTRASLKFQGHVAKNRRFWPKFGVSGL